MNIFNNIISDIRKYMHNKKDCSFFQKFQANDNVSWPETGKRDIILKPDLGREFGSPDTASVSFLIWSGDLRLVKDGQTTLIGPDITQTSETQMPFGNIVILGVDGMNESNAYKRNREIYLKKFDVSLKGIMLKTASHYMAEWRRISTEALDNGISFSILGNALINAYKQIDYVFSAEVIFVTSSNEDVNQLYNIGNRSTRMVQAMNKMVNEMSYDCSECEYQDVCEEADDLRELREKVVNK